MNLEEKLAQMKARTKADCLAQLLEMRLMKKLLAAESELLLVMK